ncbi:hypothetical protein BEP19_14500 [Ammoniphilus oxalaticus]|uniref:PDZ domain-containing protein n=1 Tax=Ammoniphilus oxalaticus TaxID=66863 RepID=A0A419SEU4_9BACL|nr:PDZ domain-containing protein [Ammoniphilus oxalaticus]RKD21821.1 hypothetical protein BEP19_14500 [Ammoniphilus oxalaticus]
MDWIVSFGSVLMRGIPSIFINPFLYFFLALAWMLYQRQTLFERKLFHRRLNRPWEQWTLTLIYGLLGAIFGSMLLLALGVILQPFDLWTIVALSFIFSFFHVQLLSFTYAVGCYALIAAVVQLWPQGQSIAAFAWLWERLALTDVASIIGLAAILYFVEAFLVRRNRGRGATPIFLNGKRGRLVGAYQLQKFWMLPMVMVVSIPDGAQGGLGLPSWWPLLLAGDQSNVAIIGFPIMLGFSDLMLSRLPSRKAGQSALALVRVGLVLLLLALFSMWSLWAGAVAGLFALFGHPLLSRWNHWKEWQRPPMFVQLGEGAVVLAVFPDTPAAKMGITSGDVLMKVNDQPITSSKDLYPALQLNSAFCKMEVRNIEGHMKYAQRAVYEGEHHQLGLILAPDERTPYYVDLKPVSIAQLFRQQIDRGA